MRWLKKGEVITEAVMELYRHSMRKPEPPVPQVVYPYGEPPCSITFYDWRNPIPVVQLHSRHVTSCMERQLEPMDMISFNTDFMRYTGAVMTTIDGTDMFLLPLREHWSGEWSAVDAVFEDEEDPGVGVEEAEGGSGDGPSGLDLLDTMAGFGDDGDF